ncbi:MAG: ABC transporter ATP-binding protein [Chloroflexota bacterium]
MSNCVVSVENLSKSYQLGVIGTGTFRGDLRRWWARARGKPDPYFKIGEANYGNRQGETIWALRDINFAVQRGETVGIIGRNGAGKSTLLKILSQVTSPTSGVVKVRGRIASLLEVGTGFHMELTGRENIFLNGAIMGMDRSEIQRKFDEIVDFSGVEKFIDTPVKRYSSGMYVRLGFAVAAHLEPEILIVDEVLAVGDAEFQKKCLGKMGDVAKEGRTVLFVSHNMASVQQLCQSGIMLNDGKIDFLGDIKNTINHYVQDVKATQAGNLSERQDRQGSQWLRFTKVGLYDRWGNEQRQVISGQDVFLRFYYVSDKVIHNASVNVAFSVTSSQGYLLANLNSPDVGKPALDLYPTGFFQCAWPRFNLRSGSYDCALFCAVNGEIVDWLQSAFSIQVEDGDFFNTGKLIGREGGDVLISYDWTSHSESIGEA